MSEPQSKLDDFGDFDEAEEPNVPCCRCHKVGPVFLTLGMRSMATDIKVSGDFCIDCIAFADSFLKQILAEEVAKTRRLLGGLSQMSMPPKLNRAARRAKRRK